MSKERGERDHFSKLVLPISEKLASILLTPPPAPTRFKTGGVPIVPNNKPEIPESLEAYALQLSSDPLDFLIKLFKVSYDEVKTQRKYKKMAKYFQLYVHGYLMQSYGIRIVHKLPVLTDKTLANNLFTSEFSFYGEWDAAGPRLVIELTSIELPAEGRFRFGYLGYDPENAHAAPVLVAAIKEFFKKIKDIDAMIFKGSTVASRMENKNRNKTLRSLYRSKKIPSGVNLFMENFLGPTDPVAGLASLVKKGGRTRRLKRDRR